MPGLVMTPWRKNVPEGWLLFAPIANMEEASAVLPSTGSQEWFSFAITHREDDLIISQIWQEQGIASSRISPNELVWGRADNSSYPKQLVIDALHATHLFVRKPFRVELSMVDNEYLGEIQELELYSFGEREADVIEELREDIEALFTELSQHHPDRLGKLPTEWLKILNQHIVSYHPHDD